MFGIEDDMDDRSYEQRSREFHEEYDRRIQRLKDEERQKEREKK